MYLSKNDANGDSKNLNIYNQIDLRLNDDEIKNAHAILAICNGMIERNPIEYKYNSLVASIINNNKFIEYNDIENKYYLNEIAYKTIYFERKYRDYAQQLPVLAKGMIAYGYEYSAKDLKSFNASDIEGFDSLKSAIQTAYDDRVKMNTSDIEELIDLITEDRLLIYRGVLSGEYDIKKGKDWKEDQVNKTMVVKNIEMFEKVVPLFVSMSKLYNVVDIKDIFEHCRNKNGSFNFAAIRRIRMLINILYNNKQKRLDIPIQDYMNRIYNFVENNEKVRKQEIDKFIYDFTIEYAKMESKNGVIIEMSPITIQTMVEIFTNIFKCLVECSRPKKGYLTMKKVELLWEEKQDNYSVTVMNEKIFALAEFLQYIDIDKEEV
jgi:hypothetical protein